LTAEILDEIGGLYGGSFQKKPLERMRLLALATNSASTDPSEQPHSVQTCRKSVGVASNSRVNPFMTTNLIASTVGMSASVDTTRIPIIRPSVRSALLIKGVINSGCGTGLLSREYCYSPLEEFPDLEEIVSLDM
jgi:hypothetical protein